MTLLERQYDRKLTEAAERMAGRMGCVFVKDDRWPTVISAGARRP